jgi:hypothetical protein
MNRKDFDVAAGIVERMDKLEKTIFQLQGIMNKKAYKILATDRSEISKIITKDESEVNLIEGEIATEVFVQDILQYYVDTLNLELNELRKDFENI